MNAVLERIETFYSGLQPREQLFVRTGAILVGVLLVLGLPWQLHVYAQKVQARVAAKAQDVAYLQAVAPFLASQPATQDGLPLVSVVDASTRDAGLSGALRGTEPSGNDSLRVRFEGASFAQMTNWFAHLGQDFGVSVQQATLEHTDAPGRVNASIVLVRR